MSTRKKVVAEVIVLGAIYIALGVGRLVAGGSDHITANQLVRVGTIIAMGVGLILGSLVGLIKNRGE